MTFTYQLPGGILATRETSSEAPFNLSFLCIECGKTYAVATVETTCALQKWQAKHGVCPKCSVPHKSFWLIPGGIPLYQPDVEKDSRELIAYHLLCEIKHFELWSQA